MKIYALIVASLFALSVGSAYAMHCPADMKKIDEAMATNPAISAEQKTEVMKYRQEGEALHKEGKHAESVAALAKALAILKIQ
ncbi:MAG: hypothetical protein HQL55_14010 [Magnetococcales bacterium]|nr:hypothetical protein [Magnetococcales bacterium]